MAPRGSSWPKHSFLSASKAILDRIPSRLSENFPVVLHFRSAFTVDLQDDIWTNMELGQNFLKISERLASLNFRKFHQRIAQQAGDNNVNEHLESFYSNVLYSFPSNDKLMHIFLSHYEKVKHGFVLAMENLRGTVLSFDHTFKVSKHVGIVRNDQCFVKQFDNCFLE
jgi:hypothetical protein